MKMGKDSELLQAVKKGDVPSIRKFLMKFKSNEKAKRALSKKLHVNSADENGFTVLHHAALVNNVEVVLALLEMEADPNARDKKGMCPLHMAAWAGKEQIVKALIENRALVNLPSFSGETPLLLASQHGYANVVEILLKYNADPTIRNNDLESPLDLACQFGHAAAVKMLLMKGEVAHMLRDKHDDTRYKNPLHVAAKGGHADVVRLLIESGADINEVNAQGSALHLAALYGKVEVVKLLLEAGADVNAVNKKNMTPLDMMNQFTTSRAGIEIKVLLREASGERIVYARAVTDHVNVYDPTCLSFKVGDMITILEQNENGRWKGSVNDGQQEKMGFFPAKAVAIMSNKRETQSLGSMSSSSDSSISSLTAGKDINNAPKSPSKRMSDSQQPVGVVPVGSFEVLTLTTASQNQERKKPGSNLPRLNSFKKGSGPIRNRRTISNEQISVDEPQSPTLNSSMDSGVYSHGTIGEPTTDNYYDKVPTTSSRIMESNLYDPVPSPNTKTPRIYEVDMTKQESQQFQATNSTVSPNNYADIFIKPNGNKPVSPGTPITTGYAEVYVSEKPMQYNDANNMQSQPAVIKTPPRGSQQKHDFSENYENMNFSGENVARLSRTPEEISKLRTASQIGGYEDMTRSQSCSSSESFPSPPLLPLKNSMSNEHQQLQAPLPPKKIESRAIHRRQDSYENVTPRQLVPVQIQNPFDNHHVEPISKDSSLPSSATAQSSYANYENYTAPGVDIHSHRSNTYENYRPQDTEEKIVRASTVAEKPRRIPASRPVPLPPKMNRRNSEGPMSPALNSPSDATSSSPFLGQMNLEELKKDERELLTWLIEMKLPQYFHNFQVEGYDMISIRGLSPEDLNVLNITKAGHKKKLLSEVAKLNQSDKLPCHKPDDVGTWLGLLGLQMYEENFIDGGFDDMDFIKDLDLSDLEMIDIKKKGHQRKLLLAVQKLADVELTADLDKVIQGTAPATSATQHQPQQQQEMSNARQLAYSNQSSTTSVNDNFGQTSHPLSPRVAAPMPFAVLDKPLLSNRDHLPPPSGTESVASLHEPSQPIPPKVPAHTTEQVSVQQLPLKRDRTRTSPNAPRPKPKPKPGQNRGQVRTASEYHATESSNKTVILPTPAVQQRNAPPQHAPDESATLTASKSRDIWPQGQENSADKASRSNSIKPVISPRPSIKPKTVAMKETNMDSAQSDQQERSTNVSNTGRQSIKKVPPPTPPRRDSTKRENNTMIQENQTKSENDRTRTMSGPLDEKIRDVFRGRKLDTTKHSVQEPVMQNAIQEEVEDSTPNKCIDDELEATDSIMADIDNMIADFNSQLDSMF